MRHRSNIYDLRHIDTCSNAGTDSRLTSLSRTLNVCFNFTQTEVISDLAAVSCCHLRCVRSIFLAATETLLTSRRPTDNLAVTVSNRNDYIIERRHHVELAYTIDLHYALLCCNSFLCHN